jgi:hypothetical protein
VRRPKTAAIARASDWGGDKSAICGTFLFAVSRIRRKSKGGAKIIDRFMFSSTIDQVLTNRWAELNMTFDRLGENVFLALRTKSKLRYNAALS